MTANTDVHTCSYYCERPECVRLQRAELRDRMESALAALQAENERLREEVDALRLNDASVQPELVACA